MHGGLEWRDCHCLHQTIQRAVCSKRIRVLHEFGKAEEATDRYSGQAVSVRLFFALSFRVTISY